MDSFPHGNDLAAYVMATFEDLTKLLWSARIRLAVKAAGCDVEDHDRGLRSWAYVGADTVMVPPKGNDPKVADYFQISERTLPSLDRQIQELVSALGREIERDLARSRVSASA